MIDGLTEAEIEALPVGGELLTQEDLADAVGPEFDVPEGRDGDRVMKLLWDDLIRGEHAKAVMVEAEMRRVIEFNQSVDHRCQEGLGQLVARIPLDVFLHWQARYGPEFWNQSDSLDFFAARNPGFRIRTKGRPTIIKTEAFPSATRPEVQPRVSSAPVLTTAGASATPLRKVSAKRGRWARP